MPISVTQGWAEASVTNPKNEVPLATLEFHHPAFVDDTGLTAVRVVRNTVDFTGRLEVDAPLNGGQDVLFQAIMFNVDWHRIGPLGAQAKLTLDNVNREVGRYLEAATTMNVPVTVIARGYLATDPTVVGQGPYRLELRNVSRAGQSLTGSLIIASPGELKFGKAIYGQVEFPSLLAAS
jgi:hypothetical protein